MLKISNLEVAYGESIALQAISLHVSSGEVVALVGSNGAGKSTILRSVSGLLKIRKGRIFFEELDITNLEPHTITSLGIAHVPEGRRIFPGLTVAENLEIGCSARARVKKEELRRDIEYVLRIFPDLREKLDSLGWSLSGGQQQMLAIARSLMAKPKLLMLDEPSLGLSPILVTEVFEVIRNINRQGTTVLLVEQNAYLALNLASRGYVIENGKVILEDDARKLLKNSMVRDAYLGKKRIKVNGA
jgi:branched-chain amino acid transport system ATP-binding protein